MKTEVFVGVTNIESVGFTRGDDGGIIAIYADIPHDGGNIRMLFWKGQEVSFEQTADMSVLRF